MRISNSLAPSLLVAILAALPVAACSGSCGGGNASSSSADAAGSATAALIASASASAQKPRPFIRASGNVGMILRAVQSQPGLTDAQKAELDQIGTDLHAANSDDDGGARSAMRDMHAELVSEVRAGKIDSAKLGGMEKAIETTGRTRRLAEADALNKAWKMLDPAQRKAVSAQVRGAEDKRQERMHRRDAGMPNFAKLKFEHYTKDLALEPDQQKKVDAMIPKEDKFATDAADEAKKQLDEMIAGFESDSFDARKWESADALKKNLMPLADTVKFVGQIVPILNPVQRDKLAGTLEKEHAQGAENRMRRRGPDRAGEDEELLSW
jgi:Spy/CpxP family protein refolding chaperone